MKKYQVISTYVGSKALHIINEYPGLENFLKIEGNECFIEAVDLDRAIELLLDHALYRTPRNGDYPTVVVHPNESPVIIELYDDWRE